LSHSLDHYAPAVVEVVALRDQVREPALPDLLQVASEANGGLEAAREVQRRVVRHAQVAVRSAEERPLRRREKRRG